MLDERKENRRLRLIQLMAERRFTITDHLLQWLLRKQPDQLDKERTKPPKRAAFFATRKNVTDGY